MRHAALAAVALPMLPMVLLASCTPAAESPSGPQPSVAPDLAPSVPDESSSTLRWGIGEPSGITPDTALDDPGLTIVDLLFDSLTTITPDGRPAPSAAAAWISQGNATRWVFTLGPGVFHDDTPVTATDMVRGWEAAVEAGRPQLHNVVGYQDIRNGSSESLRGLEVVDGQTLAVQLSAPDPDFPLVVAHPTLGPLPPQGTGGNAEAYHDLPVGNGPFVMAEPWARGRFVRMTRADDSFPQDQVQEVIFRISDAQTSYVRFQQDRIDVSPIPVGALEDARTAFGSAPDGSAQVGVHTDPRAALVYVGVSTQQGVTALPDVRKAISFALDRTSLARQVGEGNVNPARGLVPPAIPEALPTTCTTCRRRITQARRMFAEHDVRELTLVHLDSAGDRALVLELANDLAEAGVTLSTRSLAFDELLEEVESGGADLYLFGWQTEIPSPRAAVAPLVSGRPQPGVNVNYGGYSNQVVEDLLRRARTSQDRTRRRALVAEAETIALRQDQAIIPLFTTQGSFVTSRRVRGLSFSPFGDITLENVQVVP